MAARARAIGARLKGVGNERASTPNNCASMDALQPIIMDKVVSFLDYPSTTMLRFVSKRYAARIPVRRGVTKHKACRNAVARGNLAYLRWATPKKASLDTISCATAAAPGHLDVLQWLRAHGRPLNEWTCAFAAEAGQLGVLRWARAHGCPWDKWTCIFSRNHKTCALEQWAHEHGCPCSCKYRVAKRRKI